MNSESRLTEGNIFSSLVRFALPFLGAAFLQQLYGFVDTLVVGQFATDSAAGLSAITTGAQLIYMVTTLVLGLGTGGTVLIGQYLGAGKKDEIRHTMGTMFPLFGIVGLVISILLICLAGPIVSIMQVPEAAVADTKTYLIICGAGFLFVTGYNMISGMLRGLGDSRTPMILVAIACVINIVLDIILVGPVQMGVAGAAVATITAQAVSFIMSLFMLRRRKDYPLEFHLKNFQMRGEQNKLLLKLGAPIGLQDFFIAMSFSMIAAFVNRLGLSQSACVGVSNKVTGIFMLVATAFLSTIAAMTAINIGNNQPKRALQVLKYGMILSFAASAVLAIIFELFPGPILGLFTSDPDVIEQGILYTRSNAIDIAIVSLVFAMNGFFSGCGHSTFSLTNSMIATFCVRVAGTLVISLIPGTTMFHVGLAAPAASVVQIIIQSIYLASGRWRRGGVLGSGENPEALEADAQDTPDDVS